MSPFPQIAAILLLCAVEGFAYWWMHPSRSDQGEPMLAYRPSGSMGVPPTSQETGDREQESGKKDQRFEISDQEEAKGSAESTSSLQKSTFVNRHSSISSPPTSTPQPEIYRQAAPMLRCSSGQTFRVDTPDSLTLHLAFFEWDGTDTGSVLEAFRHMPEVCLGSIGMKLISKEPPILYTVGGEGQIARGGESQVGSHEPPQDAAQSTPPDQKSTIKNPQSSISPSSPNQTLSFDHTVFHDVDAGHSILPRRVHSFRAVWVSGMDATDARKGINGMELSQLRTIRLKAAATRYRPPHACVIQGTVRGAPNAAAAWQAFEQNMLRDLRLEPTR